MTKKKTTSKRTQAKGTRAHATPPISRVDQPLRCAEDFMAAVELLYDTCNKLDTIDPEFALKKARGLAYILQTGISALKTCELERRIEEIERKLTEAETKRGR